MAAQLLEFHQEGKWCYIRDIIAAERAANAASEQQPPQTASGGGQLGRGHVRKPDLFVQGNRHKIIFLPENRLKSSLP